MDKRLRLSIEAWDGFTHDDDYTQYLVMFSGIGVLSCTYGGWIEFTPDKDAQAAAESSSLWKVLHVD